MKQMTTTFICDKCGEKFITNSPMPESSFGYAKIAFPSYVTDASAYLRLDLCTDCAQELMALTNDWVNKDKIE